MAVLATPEFDPSPDRVAEAFRSTYELLRQRFGEPSGGYLAVIQGRARDRSGWLFRSNDAIVAAARGGALATAAPSPRDYFGHEVAHGWTQPTGAAANFLREGWATYAEALLLAAQFGPDVERAFWEHQRNLYETGGFEGEDSILDDPLNGGIAYSKGAWIFRALENDMGRQAFDAGLRAYMATPPGEPAGLDQFVAALSRVAGEEMGPVLAPWVEEMQIPDLRARLEGSRLVLTQSGPVFRLPVEVELRTATGPVRRTVRLESPEQSIDVSELGPIESVRLDPDRRLLRVRHLGETVRFELARPGAGNVELQGSFTSEPIPAARSGERWVVEIPLTEGLYRWSWVADGETLETGERQVRSVGPVENAYPR